MLTMLLSEMPGNSLCKSESGVLNDIPETRNVCMSINHPPNC